MSRMPKYLVVDDFLAPDVHAALLAHTLENEPNFIPSGVSKAEGQTYDPAYRLAWYCPAGLGPMKAAFKAALAERLDEILPAIGVPAFEIAGTELELAAHRDGSFFSVHMDTHTKSKRAFSDTDRIVTLVYYFHVLPRRFSGGELALHPFGTSDPIEFEPKDNRLLAFPANGLHEVKTVRAPEDFAGARFAVNCWLHRARGT